MRQFLIRMRMVLGGTICGSFIGLFVGAVSAVAYGSQVGNHSYDLLVALGGGVVFGLPGALYGALVAPPPGRVSDKIRRSG